jgi:CRISPR locus-related DNA-binding protein
MTVIMATVGFSPGKVHPILRSEEDKEEVVLFHDKDHEGRSKKAAQEAAEQARKLGVPVHLVETDAFDLVRSCQQVREQIRKRAGKDVVVSIAGGTRVLGSAALLASILEGVRVVHIHEKTNEPQPLPMLKLKADEVLSPEQRRVLQHVFAHPGCQQRDIAAKLDLSKGTVSHHVRGLKDQGLVRAEPDEQDARSERLHAVASAELLLLG